MTSKQRISKWGHQSKISAVLVPIAWSFIPESVLSSEVFSASSLLSISQHPLWICSTGHLTGGAQTNLLVEKYWAHMGIPFAGVFGNTNLLTQILKTSLEPHHISSLFVMDFSKTRCPSNPCVQDHVVGILECVWKQLHFAVGCLS